MNEQSAAETVQSGVAAPTPGHLAHPKIIGISYRPYRNPSLLPLFSVLIMTLAFFVLLNSMSRVAPERSKQVLHSVDQTFGTFAGANLIQSSDGVASAEAALVLQRIFQPMENLAPNVARVRRVMAQSLEFRFSTAWLFPGSASNLGSTASNFLAETTRLLRTRPAQWGYELEMALIAREPGDIAFARAASLATALAATGGPDRLASVSVSPGSTEEVAILIRLLPPEITSAGATKP